MRAQTEYSSFPSLHPKSTPQSKRYYHQFDDCPELFMKVFGLWTAEDKHRALKVMLLLTDPTQRSVAKEPFKELTVHITEWIALLKSESWAPLENMFEPPSQARSGSTACGASPGTSRRTERCWRARRMPGTSSWIS